MTLDIEKALQRSRWGSTPPLPVFVVPVLVVAFFLVLTLIGGCERWRQPKELSELQSAERTLVAVHATHNAAKRALAIIIEADLVEACESAEDRNACVDERAARWTSTEADVNAVSAALDVADHAVFEWARGGGVAMPASTCSKVRDATRLLAMAIASLAEHGADAGLRVPTWECVDETADDEAETDSAESGDR